jgi:thymidine kinase
MDGIYDNEGFLHIISGCMFSGKTTKLKELLGNYSLHKGYNTVLYSHDNTDRNRNNRVNPFSIPTNITYIVELNKYTIIDDNIKVIGIDEAQFFNENIIEFVHKYLRLHKIIIISGLDGTFEGKSFGHIHNLIQHAYKFDKLTARCNICISKGDTNYPALYSARVSNNKELIVIGDDKYMPMCSLHYYEHCSK